MSNWTSSTGSGGSWNYLGTNFISSNVIDQIHSLSLPATTTSYKVYRMVINQINPQSSPALWNIAELNMIFDVV